MHPLRKPRCASAWTLEVRTPPPSPQNNRQAVPCRTSGKLDLPSRAALLVLGNCRSLIQKRFGARLGTNRASNRIRVELEPLTKDAGFHRT